MITKKDLKKINNYLWEIPKEYRKDMLVPGRVYASEKMIDEILKDKSLEQLVNLSCLKGIKRYGLVMPDCHEGYASPIGGVAAIDIEEGIISPGMCLKGDTKILHSLGFYLNIRDFKKRKNEEISCFNFKKKNLEPASILKFFKLKTNSLLKVTTKSGNRIEATSDHPFYTPNGMITLENLKEGDKIAIFPFKGVSYEKPKEKILVNEDKIKKAWQSLNQDYRGHGLEQIIQQLKFLNLLPLKITSPQWPYLLKIMGYLLGDGTMYFFKQKKRGQIIFYGRKEDLKLIKKDLESIGFNAILQQRKRKHQIRTIYKNYSFKNKEISLKITSSSLVLLLKVLGMPIGNKTTQSWSLPPWLFNLPLWQKRLFLAGFFGAELSSPQSIINHSFNFYMPVLSLNKSVRYYKSGERTLKQISKLLKEFGVVTKKISKRKEYIINRKEKRLVYRWRLILSSSSESLINLFEKIGYEYQQRKRFLANLAIHYLKLKQRFIRDKILNEGIKSRKGIIEFKKLKEINLEELIKKGGRKLARPFKGEFPTFKEYIKTATTNLKEKNVVWDEIEKIEKIPFRGYVYDFTLSHKDHNFIANNFIVSNCGYDINCGMKLMFSNLKEEEIKPYLEKLATEIYKEVPSGLGKGRKVKLDISSLNKILEKGAQKLLEQGYLEKEDIQNCESEGRLSWADPEVVSFYAKQRGQDQVGTLGSGNHFLEIQKVKEIYDEETAKVFGLFKDQITIMIHTGSRGLGHQVATDYIREFLKLMDKYQIKIPDREFACVPFNSKEGQRYFRAMACAANYAWANRGMIAYFIRQAWKKIIGEKEKLEILYDVAHNIIKKEKYIIDGKEKELIVHRKGATRSFPKGSSEIPLKFQEIGQPVLIPGSMGTSSYILKGTEKAEESFYSTCHGAGRVMSRHQAIKSLKTEDILKQLKAKGIIIKCASYKGLLEEAPEAYKNIEEVVEVVHQAGLSLKVAKLQPLTVIKGE